MGLILSAIDCNNFRSYHQLKLDEIGMLTLIIGPNATGKTNLLEGIQYTTAAASFRHPTLLHLIRSGEKNSWFKSVFEGDGRHLEVELRCSLDRKDFYLNGKKKQAHKIRGILPSVLFCPDDLNLIKGSQSVILRQKNSCLKQEMPHEYLSSINEVLASIGAQLYHLRSQLVTSLIPYIQDYYYELSLGREEVSIRYIPSWERAEANPEEYQENAWVDRHTAQELLLQKMENDYPKEHERHMSLYGPQIDRIEFYLDKRNASSFASQGQQRSLVLSYKMAEVALIKEKLGQNPLLLLDDVMSELDNDRRSALFSLLSEGIQTFITATNSEMFDESLKKQARIVELGFDGVVSYG